MKRLKGNAFLYFGDKNVSKISVIWKVFHISLYIAVALSSFITAMAAGSMFQAFNYNCILYCTDIEFEKEVLPMEPVSPHDVNSHKTEPPIDNNGTMFTNADNFTESDFGNATDSANKNITNLESNNNSASLGEPNEVANKESESIVFKNETYVLRSEEDSRVIIQAKIDIKKSIFPSNSWCNYILGLALVTFIFATFCVVILAMCSKGGKGRNNTLNKPQNMMYPILVSSFLLGILNLVASIAVKNGMKGFCASFQLFTGEESCSPLINKFTLHERQDNFYLSYLVLSHAFNLTVIFFVGQVAVTLLRVIYAVDYQLYAVQVQENEEDQDFEIEDGLIVKERAL